MQTTIDIQDVSKTFGSGEHAVKVLQAISVAIAKNEFFTLLGPSGCGKTTLLRLIGGFEFPDSGSILLENKNITYDPPHRRPVNTVFQNYALFPHLSVTENIAFGLEMLKWPKSNINTRVAQMLQLVKMEELKDRRTDKISGGQQQRVALARALAPSPKVLLLDEPLSALDYKLRKEMQVELKRMQAETGITFIFVTHDQEEALTMSDRIAVMSAGEILQIGSPEEIYERPSVRFVADFIGDTNFLDGKITASDDTRATVALDRNITVPALLPQTGRPPNDDVTIVIRPEYASTSDDKAGSHFTGKVENIVYTGTDLHILLRLGSGQTFKVRNQNSGRKRTPINIGDEVGITLADNAAQILQH